MSPQHIQMYQSNHHRNAFEEIYFPGPPYVLRYDEHIRSGLELTRSITREVKGFFPLKTFLDSTRLQGDLFKRKLLFLYRTPITIKKGLLEPIQ